MSENVKEKKTFPTFYSKYKNDFELIEKLLLCYSLLNNKPLRQFELTVLKYYIKYGLTDEAKEFIEESEKKKTGDIRVANTHLRNKGFIIHGVNNLRKSELSPDMLKIRDNFILNKNKLCILVFNRDV